jgi:AraC-like DNA-binding protein
VPCTVVSSLAIGRLRLVTAQRAPDRCCTTTREERNTIIRRLHALGHSRADIAETVGCSPATVFEVINPERQAAYNERRRKHARRLTLAA